MVTLTHQERFKTIKGVFDAHTDRTLFELQSRGIFDELISPVFVGKESNVFSASRGKKKVIVKIYRMQNFDFKTMYDYIRKDPRYQFLKNHRRQIIMAWAQREYKNLMRAKTAKIRTPQAIGCRNHIIVEEFIGDDEPAPPLKDSYPEDPEKFFKEVLKQMKKLYKVGLIHGDLSAFNILNHHDQPYFIDYSQSTLIRTPNSIDLIERDVRNICHFFKKLGVATNYEETLKKIVG